jgi:FKBP-type peptidyl-prolyl cis-trans isomerase
MIPGFIEGLEKLSLVIRPFYSSPHLAYGAGGAGDVTSNTNIVFEIELLKCLNNQIDFYKLVLK